VDDMIDVLVVGAGPVGLVAACELVRQGANVRIVDQLEQPDPLSRAVVVHPRTQEALAALRVLSEFEAVACPQLSLEIFAGPFARERVRIGTDVASRYQQILDLPQSETEAILARRARELGLTIERGTRLTALRQTADGVDVVLSGRARTEQLRVAWLVGADGAHSTVRAAVGAPLNGVYKGHSFLLADIEAQTGLSSDTIRMFAHPDGVSGAFPMAGGRTRLLFQAEPTGSEPTPDLVQRLIDERMGGQWRVTVPYWLSYFEGPHGQVPRYRFDRVLLAGDAAHIHSPAGGQGMNTGIQDAANLAWKLALVSTGRADARLLDSYDAERYPVAAQVVKQTTIMHRLMTSAGAGAQLRDVALFLLGHVHPLGAAAVANLAEVTVNYRSSPIVDGRGRHRAGTVRPGDHAPEVDGLTDANGLPAYIGDQLHRAGHVVLVRGHTPAELAAIGDLGTVTAVVDPSGPVPAGSLVDSQGAFSKTYDVEQDGLVVIRPDGYVGAIAHPASPGALEAYLARLTGGWRR
jgi:2-polyprenyl-6-methoxyphenol hydroxylase-like FAD-dependent oxidoreductase